MEVTAGRCSVCPDARSRNIGDKVDDLAQEFSRLNVLIKQEKRNSDTVAVRSSSALRENYPMLCFYCCKPGHVASGSEKNSHSYHLCSLCGQLGDSEATCWHAAKNRTSGASEDRDKKEKLRVADQINVFSEFQSDTDR